MQSNYTESPKFLTGAKVIKLNQSIKEEAKNLIKPNTLDLRPDLTESGQDSYLLVRTANKCLADAHNRPIPRKLFGNFFFETELCILFADSNLGKSILAVQIADLISKGKSLEGFENESEAQPVLYFDFELSDKQFENRYSEGYKNHYQFSDSLIRIEINHNAEIQTDLSFEDSLFSEVEAVIIKENAKVLIIDNLTYLRTETEKAKFALPLMKELKKLKSKYNLTILALAHTPKRDLSKPITANDLQGSKMLINFCDSCFCIGGSFKDSNLRYLKQVKQRNCEQVYDSENVCLFQITKNSNFLGFEFLQYSTEFEHLKQLSDTKKEDIKEQVFKLQNEGKTIREIAIILEVSKSKVGRILKPN